MFRYAALALLLLGGCKDPNVGTEPVDAAAAAASAAPSASASGAASASAPVACTADADCRTFASYCADTPCACQVLAKSAVDPTCSGGTVSCLVNPCARKTAACQGGQCQLVPQPSK